jgi:hypothetical protein
MRLSVSHGANPHAPAAAPAAPDLQVGQPCAKIRADVIAIGSQFYPAAGDAERRQSRARAALLALDRVVPINLQFLDEDFQPAGFRTLRVLRRDSRTLTGAEGLRKPIVSDMFDALAGAARTAGCRYFAYLNNDIIVTQPAIDTILAGNRDGYAFSRVDVDPETGAETGIQIFGLDLFAIDAAWWTRERRRFRPYIAGEACWDNVFAALVCAHGNGRVVNDRPGIYHERHATAWNDGPFARYNGYLAALDSPDFSRWVRYATRLNEMLKSGVPGDRERLATELLSDPRLSARETVVHAARKVRARLRQAWSAARR